MSLTFWSCTLNSCPCVPHWFWAGEPCSCVGWRGCVPDVQLEVPLDRKGPWSRSGCPGGTTFAAVQHHCLVLHSDPLFRCRGLLTQFGVGCREGDSPQCCAKKTSASVSRRVSSLLQFPSICALLLLVTVGPYGTRVSNLRVIGSMWHTAGLF